LIFNMTAQLIDGNALSRQLRSEVAERALALKARGVTPGLAVVLVGDNPASQVYVRNKVKACGDVGFHSVLEKYDATLSEAALLDRIASLNPEPSIHGLLVHVPLHPNINPHTGMEGVPRPPGVARHGDLGAAGGRRRRKRRYPCG